MKRIDIILLCVLVISLLVWTVSKVPEQPQANTTPNQLTALEARVTVLEGQVKELRRIVGIDKGLSEGLQKRGKK